MQESPHGSASAGPAKHQPRPATPRPRLRDAIDLLVAVALVAVAATARLLPEENTARLLLTLPVLLFIPGYLLVQVFTHARTRRDRAVHAVVATGVSPAVVGLLALSTAALPGGFRPTPIVVAVTTACLVLAVLAYVRRWMVPGPVAQAA